jgi:hypothetical protein
LTITHIINLLGIEKNDDGKRHYYSDNRHDEAGDIPITEARIETIQGETSSVYKKKEAT